MGAKANETLAFAQADNTDEPPKRESQKTAGCRSLVQDSAKQKLTTHYSSPHHSVSTKTPLLFAEYSHVLNRVQIPLDQLSQNDS